MKVYLPILFSGYEYEATEILPKKCFLSYEAAEEWIVNQGYIIKRLSGTDYHYDAMPINQFYDYDSYSIKEVEAIG